MSTTLYTVDPVTHFFAAGYDIVQAGTVVPDGAVWAIQSAAAGAGVTINASAGGAPQLVQVPSYYNGGTGAPVGDSLPVGAEVKDSTGAVYEKTPGGWITAGGGPNSSDVGYDVYLLAGQSNMAGRGMAYDATNYDPQSGRIQQYAAAGPLAGTVAQASEPLGFPDSVALGPIGMGPGLVFARWMQGVTPENRRILLVPAAYGGTGFSVSYPLTWDVAGGVGGLYANAVAQANAAIAAAGANARFAGILWCQGEQDISMSQSAYATKLDQLISGFRSAITGASASTPFVVLRMTPGYVAAHAGSGAPGIEAAHIDTPARTAYAAVSVGQSGFDDALHFTAAGQRIAGRAAFDAFLTAKAATTTSPTVVPPAVSGLAATITATGITLSWTPQGRTATYKVEQSTDGGTNWTTAAATVYGNTYTATVSSAGTYTYRVGGQNAAGLGATTTTTSTIATPGQVTGLASPSQTSTSVTLTWTAVTVGAQAVSYLVEYSTDGGTTWLTSATVTSATATVPGLTGSTSYKFRVTAKSVGISGTPSTVLTQSTGAPVTVNDAFTRADSASSIGGSWNAPLSGTWGIRSNTGYLVTDARGGAGPYNVVGIATAPDGTVSLDITGTSIDTGAIGLAFRIVDANNYYGLRLGGNAVQAYKFTAGSTSSLGSFTFTHASSGTVTLTVVKAGSTITVKANGTTLTGLTITDTTFQAATQDGIWSTITNANSSVDNFAFSG